MFITPRCYHNIQSFLKLRKYCAINQNRKIFEEAQQLVSFPIKFQVTCYYFFMVQKDAFRSSFLKPH